MLILVGLGNPGPKYEHNRHNIGFMAVDAIARRWRFGSERSKFQSLISEGSIETPTGSVRALLMKPQTFMNESGRAVGAAVNFLKADTADVVVFYDELDLAPGRFRIKHGGGAAGHNGIRSMIAHCGPHFVRVRMGIGHPGHKALVHGYVLSDFAKADRDWLEPLLTAVADNSALLVKGEEGSFQNKVHLALNPAPEKPANKAEN